MNGLPYYKAYPRDFIEGTVGMPFELKGAYRLILDLIYMQSGALPDDARYISGLLGCSVRTWNKHRQALIEAGKISAENGIISNFRADKELETSRKLQDQQRENRSRPNKNNNLQSPPFDHTEPDTEPKATSVAFSARADLTKPDLDHIENECRKAAGLEQSISPGLFNLSPIIGCIESGADFDLDVLPTLKAVARNAKRQPASWSYFAGAIMDAHADRTTRRTGTPARASPRRDTAANAAEDMLRELQEQRNGRTIESRNSDHRQPIAGVIPFQPSRAGQGSG